MRCARVAADLRPVMLDDLGLAAAVEWLTEEFAKRTGISIQLEMDVEHSAHLDAGCDLDAEVSTAVFRIVQECLTNVARHANAAQVLVSLKCLDDRLMLRISDDGKGMHTANESKRRSFGLIGMRERAYGLGGTFSFSSIPGMGTSVEVAMPLKPIVSSGANAMIRILIADDHAIVRGGFKATIVRRKRFHRRGEAADGLKRSSNCASSLLMYC